ncbi:MAG: type I-U CRISPR-associated helicase/endonuclease Cas3, partial [Armatimonadetes bacterium]|nr:type I-U CRISPR-associated helicase/endonuclease Cas3 [Armatimonadota bacterium]
MNTNSFDEIFRELTGNLPFPWQRALFERFAAGDIPASCNLPTGLGKTNVIAIWLIALGKHPEKMPRRLVYVVNRRTVVDQTTTEAEKLRANAAKADVPVPVISTLRGQFADNREWSTDPSKPAIICGTVDMIGSRLLFSGYGVGRNSKPLHAGFLGQDVLLVHDEAHLEPAFQELLIAIENEQSRCVDFGKFRVMELTATPRVGTEPFRLTKEEREPPAAIPSEATEPIHHVWRRTQAMKALVPHPITDEKKELVTKLVDLALRYQDQDAKPAVLLFMRTVEAVGEVVNGLKKGKVPEENILTLTGTMRGLERDLMTEKNRVFARFKKESTVAPQTGTVFLVCTSAGEVGVDMSADHLVCDLSTFDSMAQRFGRVNRYGDGDATIDFVHPTTFETNDSRYEPARERTLGFLDELRRRSDGVLDACPSAMSELVERVLRVGTEAELTPMDRSEAIRKYLLPAFAPTPTILPTSDILFDAWALTTIKGQLPGRPEVESYLHGIEEEASFDTEFAWREEVALLTGKVGEDEIVGLMEEFPLRPHEVLRVPTFSKIGAYTQLEEIAARQPDLPAWVIEPNGQLTV